MVSLRDVIFAPELSIGINQPAGLAVMANRHIESRMAA